MMAGFARLRNILSPHVSGSGSAKPKQYMGKEAIYSLALLLLLVWVNVWMLKEASASNGFWVSITNITCAAAWWWILRRLSKRYEQLLAQAAESQRSLAAERDALSARLHTARQHLQHARQQKNHFLRALNREIKSPLSEAVKLHEILMDTDLDEEQFTLVYEYKQHLDRILDLMEMMQQDETATAGLAQAETFELITPIEAAIDLLQPAAREHHIAINYYVDDQLPIAIEGKPLLLQQVLVQLLSNAIRHSQADEVIVQARFTGHEPAGIRLQIAVSDSGKGMDPGMVTALMAADNPPPQTAASGTLGFGLVLVQSLAKQMGGRLRVESERGMGSSFYLDFIAREAPLPPAAYQQGPEALRGRHLLLLDDNPTNLRILSRQCEKLGFCVHATTDPARVIPMLRQFFEVEAVILDMLMPGLNGVQLAQQLRRHPLGRKLLLIMLSSAGRLPDKGDVQLFDAYLPKPVRQSRLNEVLIQLFKDQPRKTATISEVEQQVLAEHAHKSLRILVVEDNAINRKIVMRMLEKLHYQPHLAQNGQEALQAARSMHYDLIIMDLRMPVMDGLQACREILQHYEQETHRPVIFGMTASSIKTEREHCLAAGMDDFLPKPIRMQVLERKIFQWFYGQ
ncbi:MAG: response regulator [Bacteroidetes bacterium]|nr:MAG: response regulator [Bacteroidota bacterium]